MAYPTPSVFKSYRLTPPALELPLVNEVARNSAEAPEIGARGRIAHGAVVLDYQRPGIEENVVIRAEAEDIAG